MTAPDLLCLAFIALVLLGDHFVVWRAFLRRVAVDPHRARLWLYRALIAVLSTLAAAVVALWLYERRPWESLRWIAPHGWRLWVSAALVLALAIVLSQPIARVARPNRQRRFKMPPHVEKFAPHNRSELLWWSGASVFAGFSEELVFRGYLIWAFRPLLGLWGAAAFSVAVFSLAHSYQGPKGIFSTGLVGALFTLVVLILGSLWPAIAMHALGDIEQGILAWLVFRRGPGGDGDLVAGLGQPS